MQLTTDIAEILGMHAGDGYLRAVKPEFEMSGGFEEREYYDSHVIPFFEKILNKKINGRWMRTKGTYGFSVCNQKLAAFLLEYGFPSGKKSRIVVIPQQVMGSSEDIKLAFLRGYFDTDGCLTFGKKYSSTLSGQQKHQYPRIILSSVSKQLILGVGTILNGFHVPYSYYVYVSRIPTEGDRHKIQISGDKWCDWWFQYVNPSNSVKVTRYAVWKMYGFCPPRTTLDMRRKFLKGKINPDSMYGPVV